MLGYFLLFIGTSLGIIIPLILRYYFDEAIYSGRINVILLVCFVFLGIYLFNFVSQAFGAYINARFSEKVVRDVQVEFFQSIHSKSMAFHDSARIGELLAMATSDSRQLSWMLISILMFALAIFTTFASLLAMFTLNIQLFFIFLGFIPFILFSMFTYGKSLGPVSIKRQELFAKWQATLQENLAGIRVLRTLSNRNQEFKKYDEDLKAVREVLTERGIKSARYYPILILYIALGIDFIIGGYLVFLGEITPGTLIAFNSLILLLQGPSEFIRFTVFLGSMGFAGGNRVFSVISKQQQLVDGKIDLEKVHGDIEFKNVTFRYNPEGPDVLKNINLKIQSGQMVAIIGHTGCGKTTLSKLVQRLYDPVEGDILVDGKNIKNFPIDQYRRQIGVIEQDIFLFSASIRENILYGCGKLHPELEKRMIEVAKLAQIHDFISTLPNQYNTVIGERGVTLSGGQRQRLALARAFMIDPPILILDDSTSAVDSKTEVKIQNAINNLLYARTTLIITHRLSTIRKADLVVLMKGGEIEDIGTHDELYLRNEEYASIFKQFEDLPAIPTELLVEEEI
ncbi:ABC transporter ATP-binding protein [Candidatus Hodarchaeum mangrovi]